MGEVVIADIETTLDLPPDRILDAAKGKLETVLVIGWTPDDALYLGSSSADKAQILFLIETLKHGLMSGEYG